MLLTAPPAEAPRPLTVTVGRYPQLIAVRYGERAGLPSGQITGLRIEGKRVWAESADGWSVLDGDRWRKPGAGENPPAASAQSAAGLPPGAHVTSEATSRRGDLLAMTTEGAFRRGPDGKWSALDLPRMYRPGQPVPNIDSQIRAVYGDGTTVWIATDHGLYATDGGDWWHPLDRRDGMPYEDMLAVAVAPNGDIWGGTTDGAWRLRSGEWRYFHGERWIPGNRVSTIAFDSEGGVWLGTDGGVARIEERPITLEQKAAHYEEIVKARHDRGGFVTSCGLKVAGDPSAGIVPEASDNDGLWTALYVAAESFRYAVTKSPGARERADHCMNAQLDLVRLSGYPGFPARAIIRKGEVVSGYDPEETVRIPGETDKIWYTSPVDPNVLCKGDTSSDELDGHYLSWYVYYELVANAAQKLEVQKIVRAVTDNLLDHQYTLVGNTGRKTRWGVFGPQYLNGDPRWFDERGLNSAELLCYLKVASHICGDKRFSDAYEDLIVNHHYLQNTLNYRRQIPWWAINHSDDELAFCVYYPLLSLEKDPARHALLVQQVTSTWNGGPETPGLREEKSPFYSFMVGALTAAPCRAGAAVATLEDWPWELIDWKMRNSQRSDVTRRVAQGGRNVTEIDRVLPASERRVMRWNGDPYEPDGGNPAGEEDAAAWLLPYWLGRYHGIIAE